jgi:hypothetical protein
VRALLALERGQELVAPGHGSGASSDRHVVTRARDPLRKRGGCLSSVGVRCFIVSPRPWTCRLSIAARHDARDIPTYECPPYVERSPPARRTRKKIESPQSHPLARSTAPALRSASYALALSPLPLRRRRRSRRESSLPAHGAPTPTKRLEARDLAAGAATSASAEKPPFTPRCARPTGRAARATRSARSPATRAGVSCVHVGRRRRRCASGREATRWTARW